LKDERRRYLKIGIIKHKTSDIKKHDIILAIRRGVKEQFGNFGLVKMDPRLVDYNEQEGEALLSTGHMYVEQLRAALAMVTYINTCPVTLHVTGISGTLKKLRKG